MDNAAVKTSGRYTLKIVIDEDPPNPREDRDNLGRMVCWHKRYSLGDKHDYKEPEDFMRELADGGVSTGELIRFVRDGEADGLRFEENRTERIVTLMSYWDFNKYWGEEYSAPYPLDENDARLRDAILDNMRIGDLRRFAERTNLIAPLYLYDHSILGISTDTFLGRAHHAEWDSGQVGFVCAGHADIAEEYGDVSPGSIEKARKILNAETETYDCYLRGECYGFRLFKDGEEQDSCWGFLGGFDEAKEAIREYIPEDAAALIDGAEYGDDDPEHEPGGEETEA
jgi:hypothetical protein